MIWTHLPAISGASRKMPVIFPPGLLRLWATPLAIGSDSRSTATTGRVVEARRAALRLTGSERNNHFDVGRQFRGVPGEELIVAFRRPDRQNEGLAAQFARQTFADQFFPLRTELAGKEDSDLAGAGLLLGADRERPACSRATGKPRNSRRLTPTSRYQDAAVYLCGLGMWKPSGDRSG